jgi:hypothetical protein
VAADWSVSVAGVSFWMVSIGVDYVKLEKDFLVAFLGELFIWAATVGVDALFIRGVVDWYYFGVLGQVTEKYYCNASVEDCAARQEELNKRDRKLAIEYSVEEAKRA